MLTVRTVRVRAEFVERLRRDYATDAAIAVEMGVDKSTVSRWLNGNSEATPRFIGTTLLTFPVEFDDAFVVTEENAERRRARTYVHATGSAA